MQRWMALLLVAAALAGCVGTEDAADPQAEPAATLAADATEIGDDTVHFGPDGDPGRQLLARDGVGPPRRDPAGRLDRRRALRLQRGARSPRQANSLGAGRRARGVVTEPTPEHDREGLAWRSTGPREADAALLGAPFDGTSGGRPRQAQAPELVRAELGLAGASDEGTRRVWDVGDVLVDPVEPEPTLDALAMAVEAAGERAPSALPVVLGGEHTVSLAAVRALQPASIVSLDAHPDLWDHQHGREIAQGTWLRRAIETTDAEAVLLGSRTARGGEAEAIDELGVREALPTDLPEPVYLTVDVDVVDPEQAPAVVYPEPEGPSAEVVLGWIEQIVGDHELAGVDVVEVNAGRPGPTVELAAAMLDAALATDGGG